jgi:hypothetical protein
MIPSTLASGMILENALQRDAEHRGNSKRRLERR